MKVIKGLLCLVLSAYATLFPAANALAARADRTDVSVNKYACTDIGSKCWLFKQPDENSELFIIPQSYCVQIIEENGKWCRVKYAEEDGLYQPVYGYCLKEDLIPLEEPLENLYLHMPVTVTYRADSYTDQLPSLDDIEFTAAYYGAYYIGNTAYSYVYCNGNFGYITGAIEDYPLNEIPNRPTVAPVKNKGAGATLIIALSITAVAAAAIIILYFAGKKPKALPPPKS